MSTTSIHIVPSHDCDPHDWEALLRLFPREFGVKKIPRSDKPGASFEGTISPRLVVKKSCNDSVLKLLANLASIAVQRDVDRDVMNRQNLFSITTDPKLDVIRFLLVLGTIQEDGFRVESCNSEHGASFTSKRTPDQIITWWCSECRLYGRYVKEGPATRMISPCLI